MDALNWQDSELNAISTREDLARYLQSLATLMADGNVSVENPLTADFVDAAGRWTNAMNGYFKNIIKEPIPDEPSWAMIGAIFSAAMIYE